MANKVLADPHFYHTNIIKYCDRPFSSAEEMDEVLLFNINSTCKKTDILWLLGDFAYGKGSKERIESYARQIVPEIILVRGNHDHETVSWYTNRGFSKVIGGEYWEYEPGVLLSHRPYPVKPPYINIYGHVHNLVTITNWNYRCVSVEQINYTPVDLDELIKEIRENPNTASC